MKDEAILRIPIFVSSPADVPLEREIIKKVVKKLNLREEVRKKYHLEALLYEGEVPPIVGAAPSAQGHVDRYMLAPQDAYLMICLMWSRMGTPFYDKTTQKHYESGTAYEFMMAYEARQKQDTPHVLIYRKMPFKPDADPQQTSKVDAFFKQFEGDSASIKGLYKVFNDPEDFEAMLERHIDKVLAEHPPKQMPNSSPISMSQPVITSHVKTGSVRGSTIISGVTGSDIRINQSKRRSSKGD